MMLSGFFYMFIYHVYIFNEVSSSLGHFVIGFILLDFKNSLCILGIVLYQIGLLQIIFSQSVAWLLFLLISVLLTWSSLPVSPRLVVHVCHSHFPHFRVCWVLAATSLEPLGLQPCQCSLSSSHLCAIWIWLQHGHFSFLYCTFIFVDEFPFSVIHFLKIPEWACHWETSRQCSCTLPSAMSNRRAVTKR